MEFRITPSYALFMMLFLSFTACRNERSSSRGENYPPTQDTTEEGIAPASDGVKKSSLPDITEDYGHTNRVIWQKPEVVIDLLGDLESKTVADIGAGTGFFAFRLAQRAKKVIAIDIDQRFISYLDSTKMLELPEQLQDKLETRLAKPNDPMLQAGEVDVIIIVNTFMYIRDRLEYLKILKKGLTSGGMLLIIDFKKKRTPLGPPSNIRVPLFEVEELLYEAGYRNIVTNDTSLDYQYIVTAKN
jgi:SAM-dependent methyltransferase